MTLSLRTNVASLSAQRSLAAAQLDLGSSLNRLSSGFRISRAGDDAAGLGISTKLEAQLRSHGQAARNASDGLSVVRAAEAGLGEQANVLTRLRELAMQSASDGIGDVERGHVDREAQALLGELLRISQVTEFNGTRLLDGSARRLDFQVGIDAAAGSVISLLALDTSLGATFPPAPAFVTAAADAFVTSMQAPATLGDTNAASLAAFNAAQALVPSVPLGGSEAHAANSARETFLAGYRLAGGIAAGPVPPGPAMDAGLALLTSTRSGGTAGSPVLAAAYAALANTLRSGATLAAAGQAAQAAAEAVLPGSGPGAANGAGSLFMAYYSSSGGSNFLSAPPAGPAMDAGLAALGGGGAAGLGLPGLSLSSKGAAQAALGTIDTALGKLSSARATLGATGNRLQSAISSIQASTESLAAANGRIKDVDVAAETSRLTRSQILAQAGVSVLAQANQLPQLALKLLG